MSKVLITRSKLDDLATTIAAKSGATLPLTIAQMDAAVDGIVVGSGTDTSHDTVDAAHLLDGYTAHDSTGSAIVGTYTPPTFATQSKTAAPTTSQQTVAPDSGYDGLSSVTVGAIPSEYIIPSGSETKTANGTYDVTALAQLVVNVASPVKTATGTFTGNGTRTIGISSVTFEPDLVYFTSDPGTTASSGTVAAIIARDLMTATRYRNNSTTNSHYAIPGIANLNTSGSSYSWRATYDSTNSKLTLYCYSSNARGLLTNGRTYTYTFIKWT